MEEVRMKQLIDIKDDNLTSLIDGKFYIIQNQSSFCFGKAADASSILNELAEIMDAHFFDEKGDLHIYSFNGDKMASYTSEEDGTETVTEVQLIKDKTFKKLGIIKAINYDEYGQMYVEYTRPYKLS